MNSICVPGLSQFDNTLYGHYRGVRWLILMRELFFLPLSILALWRLRKQPYDLIHANEITLLPLAILAKVIVRCPLVVHVRSVQSAPTKNLRSRLINVLLARYADAVVAIDRTVALTLDQKLNVRIVHNSISLAPSTAQEAELPRNRSLRVGIFGVLIPAKGVRELVEAVWIVRQQGVDLECWIAGENARSVSGLKAWLLELFGFAHDVRSELEALVAQHGLKQQVKFLGLVKDIRSLYKQIDVLCFPSHLNAAGRPVFEAALFGVPSIVAIRDPLPDAILHEETGLAISEPQPELIADAILRLARDESFRVRLGEQAKIWATGTFSLEQSANAMQAVYSDVLTKRRQRT